MRITDITFTVSTPVAGVLAWKAIANTTAGVIELNSSAEVLPQNQGLAPDEPVPVVLPQPNIRGVMLNGLDGTPPPLPGWCSNFEYARLVFIVGLVCDAYVQWVFQAIQQRFPLLCEPGALLWIGRDRKIFRGEVQGEASYRRQLTKWLPLHKRRGLPWSVLTSIQTYFLTDVDGVGPLVRMVEHHPHPSGTSRAIWSSLFSSGIYQSYEASPSNWVWDSSDPLRAASIAARDPRGWIIVYQDPDVAGPFQILDTDPGFGSLANVIADERHGQDLKRLQQYWRSAGFWAAGIIIAQDPTLFEPTGSGVGYPDGTWHRYGTATAPNMAQPALYLEMTNTNAPIVGD